MSFPSLPNRSTDNEPWRVKVADGINWLLKVRPPNDRTPAEVAAGVTPVDYAYEPGDVRRYGAVDGQAITTAFQNAINGIEDGGKVILPAGFDVTMGEVNVNSKNIEIDGNGCRVTLVGDNAGLGIHGTVTRAIVRNWYVTGDGSNRDDDSTTAQVGILVGNEDDDDVQEVIIEDCVIADCNVGIKVANGITPHNTTERVTVINCNVSGSVGSVGGVGYGVHFSQAPQGSVIGGVIRNCGRHGLYFSEGEDFRAVNVEISGCGANNGTIRGAVSVSRSRNVVVTGLHVHDNLDVGIAIDVDAQGVAPKDLQNVQVNGGLFEGNAYGDIILGTTLDPATDGVPTNVQINNALLVVPAAAGAAPIIINQANRLSIQGVTIDATANTSGASRLLSLPAAGGAQYTDDVTIRNCRFLGGSNTAFAFEIDDTLCTGTQRLNLLDNEFYDVPANYSLGAAITNSNIKRSPHNDTYTGTLTGCTTAPTATIEYTRNGDLVTLQFPDFTATSNATTCTVTGMPVEIRPASAQSIRGVVVRDNGSDVYGNVVVETNGTLTLSVGAGAGAFTNANLKGIRVCSFTYRRS